MEEGIRPVKRLDTVSFSGEHWGMERFLSSLLVVILVLSQFTARTSWAAPAPATPQSSASVTSAALVPAASGVQAKGEGANVREAVVRRQTRSVGDFKQHLGNCVVDALLERPAGLVGMVGGFTIFVVTLPLSAGGGNVGECWEKLVKRPTRHTFARPLGWLEEEQGW